MTAFLGNILGALLRFVYDLVSNIGVEPENFSFYAMSIIITTIIFKLMLLPVAFHQVKSSKKMAEIQPLMKEIQTKYKSDPQTQQAKMAQLYKDHNYNPASGCLVLLVQLPIIFAFFAVMRNPVTYAFREPGFYEAMNKSFLWVPNLEFPDPLMWGLPLLAAATTYLQSRTMSAGVSDPQAEATQRTMSYFLPVMIFFSAKGFAAGLALYWVISNIFSIIQQLITNRSSGKIKEA